MKVKKPVLYLSWWEDGERREIGPFYTANADGYHAYEVQYAPGKFKRITIPYDYVSFFAMV